MSSNATVTVFDIDGTLVRGTLERGFIAHLMRKRLLGVSGLFRSLLFAFRYWPRFGLHVFKRNKAYLGGLSVAAVREQAKMYVADAWLARRKEPIWQRLEAHQQRGDEVILMSGTLAALADELAQCLGIQTVIATTCDVVGDGYGTAPPHRHPFAQEKAALLRTHLHAQRSRYSTIVAYGDSIHDQYLFDLADQVFCVDPDAKLRQLAQREQYTIIKGKD